ncbi:MAG: hypothetical protein ACOCV3_04790 [Halanaerobiales bacterium]
MAELILPPNKDNEILMQFKEILFQGLTKKNVNEKEFFILKDRTTGKDYRLYVDNGNLKIEGV